MITLEGSLSRIRFRNDVSSYTVADLVTANQKNTVTVVGIMPAAVPGQAVKVVGAWATHPKYGQQFKLSQCEVLLPATVDGIKKYLRSGVVKGIGPTLAESIVACFGEETLQVMEKTPERLTEVDGIGDARAAIIHNAWLEHHILRELMGFLQEKGLDAAYSARIFREYGEAALDVLKADPFKLAEDIPGIGFIVADAISLDAGLQADDPRRIRACVLHLIKQDSNSGNVFCHVGQLQVRCEKQFQIDPGEVETALAELEDADEVITQDLPGPDPDVRIVYLAPLYKAEHGVAARILALATVPGEVSAADAEDITRQVVERLAIKPSREQMRVLEEVFAHRVAVVTGGPGTGKTTLVRAITAIFEGTRKKVVLTAPTGRAAKRLAEVSGKEATTIHRLLGYNFQDDAFFKNIDNQLRAGVIIVDEASMVDIQLFQALLLATPATSVLVLVGDVFQLPSVGPGNVLRDLIDSEMLPVFALSEIFRQAQTSLIVDNAHRIRNGLPPDLRSKTDLQSMTDMESAGEVTPDLDFCFIEEADPVKVAEKIVRLCQHEIPDRFGFDPMSALQVLTPMHRGEAGTINLNQQLQQALNPQAPAVNTGSGSFRNGDKVMQLRNNYAKEIFNGDIGTIVGIDPIKHVLCVDYYGRVVEYAFTETSELSLAYAITVHKSQGSEYPAVVVPVITQHYALLERNLLYTAITRARRLLVLVGTEKAVNVAMRRNDPRRRLSLLAFRLNPDLDLAKAV